MDINVPSVISMMPFRVLVEFESDHQEWVATCLDTGAVATGDTAEEAEAQIQEVLATDIRMAIQEESIKSLDRRRAPTEIFARWYQLQSGNRKSGCISSRQSSLPHLREANRKESECT